MNDLLAAYRCTTSNWVQIEASTVCGCCHCMQIFPPGEIVAWTGLDLQNMNDPEAIDRQTATCPRCGSEAVLGDKSGFPITAQFLGRMYEAWFQPTIVRRPARKS